MTIRNRAITLVVVQSLLVASIGAKYLYERARCPRVWARTAQYDPELPMRGRYLALSPVADVCNLLQPDRSRHSTMDWYERYRVRLVARDGKLVGENAEGRLPRGNFQSVTVTERIPCDRSPVSPAIDYFVPEKAWSPFPLKSGQELWVEVTVPPSGPPRAIQLALSENGNWRVLKFN
jgi:hypothetical protein